MAGPGAPSVVTSAPASASASSAPKELSYPSPPTTLQSVEKKLAQSSPSPAAQGSAPTEQVIAPARGTLAAGRYEARPVTIWLVVAGALVVVLLWSLGRLRSARLARQKKLDALTSLKKPAP
jgi:hypothetical protein